MTDLSIIIPSLNTTNDYHQDRKIDFGLRNCIDSIQETTSNYPIYVTTNSGSPKFLPYNSNINRIKRINVWDQGQCKAVNAAMGVIETEWALITNDDMVFSPNWLSWLLKSMPGDAVCVCPNLVEPTKGAPPFLQHFCGGAGGDFDKTEWLRFARDFYKTVTGYEDYGLGWEDGFNFPLLIKKEIWDLVGGYDVNYDPWGSNSDSDLQAKIHLAGFKTLRNTNSIVYHFSQTSGTFHPSKKNYWDKNWNYFIKKWGFERQGDANKVWYSQDLIDEKRLKYHPIWEGINK